MIGKISLALVDESGSVIPIEKTTPQQLEIKIEITVADLFSQICFQLNNIADAEVKVAEKFQLAKTLINHLEEMKDVQRER